MGKIINEIGNKYGRLTVISKSDQTKSRHTYWNCLCDCGNMTTVSGTNLRTGKVISCGCAHKFARLEDLVGQNFGELTVIELDINTQDERTRWKCKCACGNIISVRANHLKNNLITNCGCKTIVSKGENKIKEILLNNNIPFEQHKYIKIDGNRYFYDFFINNTYFIEYDGIQHFLSRDSGWNTLENLKQVQKRDAIKNKWCKENNIPLIRIPYTAFTNLSFEDLDLNTSQYLI